MDGSGHIGFADWVEADSDEDAIVVAKRLRPDAHRCEIWRRDALIATLNPDGQFERALT